MKFSGKAPSDAKVMAGCAVAVLQQASSGHARAGSAAEGCAQAGDGEVWPPACLWSSCICWHSIGLSREGPK